MKTVALSNVMLTVNVAEDWGGDEPRIVLALATINTETDENRPIRVAIFDSGILGDSVPDGTTRIRVPIQPPSPNQLNDGVTKTFQATIDETRGDAFYLFAQAWDDDESSVAKRAENRQMLRLAVLDVLSSRANGNPSFASHIMRASEDTVGRDDLLGHSGQLFQFLGADSEDFTTVLTGLDGDARYTLSGSVLWADAPHGDMIDLDEADISLPMPVPGN